MTTITWDGDLPLSAWSRGTTGGGFLSDQPTWGGTTSGVTLPTRAVAAAGTAMRSLFVGMLQTVDQSWPHAAAMYYQVVTEDMPGTGAALMLRRDVRGRAASNSIVLVPERVLAEIRATLGLNISETARAVGVERPTVYAWLAGQVTPQRSNLVRLSRVADIAASWRRRSSLPLGGLVRMPGDDGRSIAELLADDSLPDRVIQERLDAVASHVSMPGASLRRRDVTSVYEAATRHGINTGPARGGASEVEWLTRPAFGDEDD